MTPEQAAKALIWLADAHEARQLTGQYFFMGEPREPSAAAQDKAAARQLWDVSEAIVAGY